MTKQEEIKILQSLKADTYLSQYFGSVDIDTMCENIKNDFPIELNCPFNKKAEVLEKELVTQRESSKKKLLSFANNIITSMYSNEGADIYKVVENCIGIDAIIKFKFSQKIELNYEEIEYLVSKLK